MSRAVGDEPKCLIGSPRCSGKGSMSTLARRADAEEGCDGRPLRPPQPLGHLRCQTPENTASRPGTVSFTFVKVRCLPETCQLYTSGLGSPSSMWTRLAPAGAMIPSNGPAIFVQVTLPFNTALLMVSVQTLPAGIPGAGRRSNP
jgi:hypothetical protein